ncbi:MAG: DUF4167 domain-containing protein [Proteobacteria bacterium]|nr:DUF4167 domain-containing protein [Pseudomonadota bacterium]MBS0572403.1 DUF4167 domain-containing protein [Pseudomonadota bacterium]
MRSSKSRSRNKSNRQRSLGNIVNRVFDSSGPEGKVRGTPQQIIDKYLMLARDAQLSNDRVAEQAFLQHAEHYTRMLGEAQREMAREQEARQGQPGQNGNGGNGHSYGDRQEGGRERYEPRPVREAGDEQPDFAPLGAVGSEEDGPGLVETPEMYHAPQPVAFEGHLPDFLAGAGEAPQEARPRRSDRRPRPDARPEARAEARGEAQATAGGDKPPRGERGPRGPRRPRGERGEGGDAVPGDAAPVPAARTDEE